MPSLLTLGRVDASIALLSLNRSLLSLVVVKNDLAHAHGLRCHLYVFVTLDIFQTFLKAEYGLRDDACLVVRAAGTHVGELLCLAHVDDKVVVMNMLTYNLSTIYILARINEELSAILQFVDTVGVGVARLQGNHRAVDTALDFTFVRLIVLEAMGHDGFTLTGRQYIGAQADDTA